MPDALIETEAERLETLRLLHTKVEELTLKIDSLKTELLGALNEKDAMRDALEKVSSEATKYRAVEALVLAITEKTR